jgi:hypothetical protein
MARWSKKQDEAMNSLIQAAKARARGYGTANHFITICFLIAGSSSICQRIRFNRHYRKWLQANVPHETEESR